jgi:hypothetical protein
VSAATSLPLTLRTSQSRRISFKGPNADQGEGERRHDEHHPLEERDRRKTFRNEGHGGKGWQTESGRKQNSRKHERQEDYRSYIVEAILLCSKLYSPPFRDDVRSTIEEITLSGGTASASKVADEATTGEATALLPLRRW